MSEYSKIVAVTGLPGLYELINSKTDGAIVRSLDDKSTKFISSRIYKLTQLETIEVFTVKDNVNLIEVFKGMDSSSEKLPDEKDSGALNKYFQQAFPDLDFEKVYASDMKKMVKWFSILKDNNIDLKLSEPPAEESVSEETKEEELEIIEKSAKPKKAEKQEKPEKHEKQVKPEKLPKAEKAEKKVAAQPEIKSEKQQEKKKVKKAAEPEKKDKAKKPAAKSKTKK
jgi:Domain of unknown function (DUF5606)